MLNLINKGRIFRVNITGDGWVKVELRIVDAREPVLSGNEIKLVNDSSETFIIYVPTGKIVCSSVGMPLVEDEDSYILTDIEPGNYKTCVYHLRDILYVVLCKTMEKINNEIKDIYCFSDY